MRLEASTPIQTHQRLFDEGAAGDTSISMIDEQSKPSGWHKPKPSQKQRKAA